jgi:hypothetical protein
MKIALFQLLNTLGASGPTERTQAVDPTSPRICRAKDRHQRPDPPYFFRV